MLLAASAANPSEAVADSKAKSISLAVAFGWRQKRHT
jgi:hypothetical protein